MELRTPTKHAALRLRGGRRTSLRFLCSFIVKLDEDDYVTAKSGIQFAEELINTEVNGNPAIYTVEVSASDKALTKLSWATGNKEFNLSVDQNAAKNSEIKDKLLEIAHSLSNQ